MRKKNRSTTNVLFAALWLGSSVFSASALAQENGANATQVGALELYPTLNNMSIYWSYKGDANRNAQVTAYYRKVGSQRWRTAHPLVRIKEAKLGGQIWTGSLLALSEGTAYEVKLTLQDADGVSGKAKVTASATTRKSPVASQGKVITVRPGESIQAAFNKATPGTTILLKKGTYYQIVTGSKSGTANAPITIKGEKGARIFGSDQKIAQGKGWKSEGGALYSVVIPPVRKRIVAHKKSGRLHSYHNLDQLKTETHTCKKTEGKAFKIKGGWVQVGQKLYIVLPDHSDPRKGGVHVSVRDNSISLTNSNYIIITGIEMAYVGVKYGASLFFRTSSNIWVHHNYIHHFRKRGVGFDRLPGDNNLVEYNSFTDFPVGDWPWGTVKAHDCEEDAISFRAGRGNVARYNIVNNLSNGIDTCSLYSGPLMSRDTDIYGNHISRIGDDAIELDGYAVNQRIYHNIINETHMALSTSPLRTGPVYFVRNVIVNYRRYIFKAQNGGPGHLFIYHNSSFADAKKIDPGKLRVLNSASDGVGNIVSRNNSFWAFHYMIRRQGKTLAPSSFDYNAYFNPQGSYKFQWGNAKGTSLAAFQKLGQEQHGLVANPGYTNTSQNDWSLKPNSPLKDKGVVIPGINDGTLDGKPDIGAFEVGSPRWDQATRSPKVTKLKP